MANTPLNLPGTAAAIDDLIIWTDPDAIKNVGIAYAYCDSIDGTQTSDLLIASNFSFSVPGNATITGLQAQLLGTCDRVFDGMFVGASYNMWLTNTADGSEIGSINPYRSAIVDMSETLQTLGSPTDLWGCTAAQLLAVVNNTTFGLTLKVTNFDNADTYPVRATVDYVKLQVFYNLAGGMPVVGGGCGCIPWWLKGKI